MIDDLPNWLTPFPIALTGFWLTPGGALAASIAAGLFWALTRTWRPRRGNAVEEPAPKAARCSRPTTR